MVWFQVCFEATVVVFFFVEQACWMEWVELLAFEIQVGLQSVVESLSQI